MIRNNIFNPFFNSTYNNIAATKLFNQGQYPYANKSGGPFVQGFSPFYSNIYGVINYPLRSEEYNSRGEEEKILNTMALESYIYGYPLVLTMITKYMSRLNTNKFYIDSNNTDNTKVKVDAVFDLKNGPVILRIPSLKTGEYTIELMDAWTDIFADLGTKTTGNNSKEVLIVGPDFKRPLPDDIDIIQSPTNTGLVTVRILANNMEKDFLDKLELVPLYDQNINYEVKRDMLENYIDSLDLNNSKSPVEIVRDMDAKKFFKIMTMGSYYNPPRQKDIDMNRKLEILKLSPSLTFDFNTLDADIQQALEFANRNGPNTIEDPINGETNPNKVYYLQRAKNAMKNFN